VRLNELFNLLFRWGHLIAGFMWIGNSMLFNWLDRNLEKFQGQGPLSQGKIYMVHSGAFYEVEKKLLAPGEMPDRLHWFKWQNFTTWATGIALLAIVYYMDGAALMIDPRVHAMSAGEAIGISIGSLIVGWAVYDGIWRTIGRSAPAVGQALSLALLLGASYGFTLIYSGRAAYIMTGVLMGTIMTGNVWMVIVPSQRSLVNATRSGAPQDATLSKRAKERSIHNNYLTFPLLFIMLSNHFGAVTDSPLRWWLLVAVLVGGAGVRHFMNVRYAGKAWLAPALAIGALSLGGVYFMTQVSEQAAAPAPTHTVDFARAQEIIVMRCVPCHSQHPSNPVGAAVPAGAYFDQPEAIGLLAPKMLERLQAGQMPLNNMTSMTDGERGELEAWIQDGAKQQ